VARPRSRLVRVLLAAGLLTAAAAGWVSWLGRLPARDLLPAGAVVALEARDAAGLLGRVAGTRFAAAFAASATRAWLERTEAVRGVDEVVRSVDAALAGAPGFARVTLRRRHLLDLVGTEAAAAWYPAPAGPDGARPWIAVCRLSWRAYAVATVLRAADRFLPAAGVDHEEAAGHRIAVFPGAGAPSVFLRGRLLVAASDRGLARQAALCASGAGAPLTREPAWTGVRHDLPERAELTLWARALELPAVAAFAGASPAAPRPACAVLRAGRETEIHFSAGTSPGASAPRTAGSGGAFPGLPILARQPLLFYAARGPLPEAAAGLLEARRDLVAARGGRPRPPRGSAALGLGAGFALAVTESETTQLLPVPRGIAVVAMKDAAAARAALPELFPSGARTARAGRFDAVATRESIPLAGEYDLWGAAVGGDLVFATGTDLIAALAAEGAGGAPALPEPGWAADAVAVVSVEKALPLLRRYAPVLAAMLSARYRGVPDLGHDLQLLGAVRTVTAVAGAAEGGSRMLLTLQLRDLP
jgi:hypothetical protein